MTIELMNDNAERWENGELGVDPAMLKRVDLAIERDMDEASKMHLMSIRMPGG